MQQQPIILMLKTVCTDNIFVETVIHFYRIPLWNMQFGH